MLLTPEYIFKNVEAITPEFLRQLGVTALVLDVDNTLTGDGSQQLDDSVAAWLDAMRAAGVSLTIVSNNTAKRVRPFAARIGLAFVPLACKPLPVGLLAARLRLGVPRRQMAMVGDQIFTDRLAAVWHPLPVRAAPHPPREKPRRAAETQTGTPVCQKIFRERRKTV